MIDDRYRVKRRVGSGGMADVYCADDLQLGRQVALKMLHRRFAEDADFVERFRREASSAAGLQHPNVVGVYDRGEWDGTYYIAMEYLDGRTLKQLINHDAPLEPVAAIDIGLQVLKAARFAHKRGIIHRDLKPHNVILDSEGRAKVTDFGIARAGASDMTETGSIMGTAQYLSPEQAQGHAVGATSDLYSIGVILWELLTGRVPFEGDAAVTVALKHVTETPPPPSTLNPAVPPELDSVVMWALAKDPAHRPADADALITALEDVRERILSEASGQRTAAFVPPPVFVPEPATALAPAAVGAPIAVAEELPPEPLEEDPEERRRGWWPWALLLLLLGLLVAGYFLFIKPDPAVKQSFLPNVVGKNVGTAQTILGNAGFQVSTTDRTNPSPKGQVIAQDPRTGRVNSGTRVALIVSSGPGQAPVPSVAGQSQAAAVRSLKKAGFKVRVQMRADDTVARGNAIDTSPAAFTPIDVGSTVILNVSSGAAQVTVPDVTNEQSDAAQSTLRDKGFTVRVVEFVSQTRKAGTVLSQSPVGGTSVAKGTSVRITVAKEPDTATVPNVKGQQDNAAVSTIQSKGFQVNLREKIVNNPDRDGKVLGQTPAGGSQLKKGGSVGIVVGRFKANPNPNEQNPTGPTGPTGSSGATGAT